MSKNIQAQIKALYTKAASELDGVTDAEDAAAVKSIVDRAEAYRAQAKELERALSIKDEVSSPRLPADLPTGGNSGTESEQKGDPAIKAVYTLRYGEDNAAIKAILRDLHGEDYEHQRWHQVKAFNHWLRDYTNPTIPAEGRKFLWTPATVKTALLEGVDVSAMKATMVNAASELGGYIVPEDWRAKIIERLAAESVVRSRATVVQTSRDVYEQPVAKGGDGQYTSSVRVTWVPETVTEGTAATGLSWGMEKVPVYTVMAETFFSRSQVEDAAFNLPAYLAEKFAEAALIDEDNQFLVGDGHGTPLGILPGGTNAMNLEEAETTATLTWDGLIDLYYKIAARYRGNACWIAENASYALIAKLKAGTDGQYYWRDQYGVHTGTTPRPPMLMGKPALESEAMASVATNAYPVLFGDLRGYTVVDRVGMSVERYLDSATARKDTVAYLMRRRLGGKLLEPWRFGVQKVVSAQ